MNEIFSGVVEDINECKSIWEDRDDCVSFEYWGESNPNSQPEVIYCHASSSCTYALSYYNDIEAGYHHAESDLFIKGK